ncbi:FMN-binding domain protein [compost metagenome]
MDVTVKSGKIYAVEVSRYAMHYSQSDIVDLPQEVIANQSAKVKNVSGATFSVQAFTDAVQNALNQAQNG